MKSMTKTKPQVVMVDDDSDFQDILRGWLSGSYDTISLADGEELLSELSTLEPDLIMLDVKLPGPDGFKLCHKIRADERFADTPILFLTSSSANEDFCKYLEVGGSAYLNKPMERGELLRTIQSLIAAS